MDKGCKIFALEDRLEELFETVYPKNPEAFKYHSSGRATKPFFISSLGTLVPGGEALRRLQRQREYVKVDFLDFLDYATSDLPPQPKLSHFPDNTAVFYESLVFETEPTDDAVWGEKWKCSIKDAAIARTGPELTCIMRFNVWLRHSDDEPIYPAEDAASLTFRCESNGEIGSTAEQLCEIERVYWSPPQQHGDEGDVEWRFTPSGEITKEWLATMEAKGESWGNSKLISQIKNNAEADNRKPEYSAYFELARLGLYLPSYVDFMYDLVVTERKLVGNKLHKQTGKQRRGKQVSFDTPIYKIIRSVRIIRPDSSQTEAATYRTWTAPSYSFLVRGHWRHFDDPTRNGRDADGIETLGKTWVHSYKKFEDKSELNDAERLTRDPRVVIGVKQSLSYARELIDSHSRTASASNDQSPSSEWMANERARLTAGLRYLILKRDNFCCRKCGKSQVSDNFVRLEVDHIIPVSKWGLTVEGNLATLCRECNAGKSNLD